MAFKKERLEKIIEREVSSILFNDVKDERIKLVTITKVSLTEDLSIATIYYRNMVEVENLQEIDDCLVDAKGYMRSKLSKKLDIRKTPDLRFKYDTSFEEGNRIEDILKAIKAKDEK